jgi:arylsulfatase
MSSRALTFTLTVFASFVSAALAADAAPAARPPNIVFFLADDLGYGDLSCYGQQKFKTPNIDRLAAEGMKMSVHYSGNAVCAPSRCVFMTGMHPGHAFVRDNREMKAAFGEGQFPLPPEAVTLPKILKELGYTTGAFGKWGLGGPTSTGEPLKQGIDRFFGYNCQAVAHNYYPTYLWDNDRKTPLDNPEFSAHQKWPAGADPNKPESYAQFIGKTYAPDVIGQQALRFVRDNKDKPFFLYYPTTVPHLALQVPEDSLAEYAGKYPEAPYTGDRNYLPHRAPRAAYAAMVTRMDREFGRVMDLVKELGLDDNTIFVFASDNGPLYDQLGGTDTDFFNSANGFRARKGSLYEGGVRIPCLVRWKGHIAPGTTSDRVSGFEDWLPTFLELIGHTEKTPKNLDGISFAPTLLGKNQADRPFLYREFGSYGGQQSLRIGNYKAVRQNLAPKPKDKDKTPGTIELYDLARDPGEKNNIAAQNPDIVAKFAAILKEQHVKSAAFPIKALDP